MVNRTDLSNLQETTEVEYDKDEVVVDDRDDDQRKFEEEIVRYVTEDLSIAKQHREQYIAEWEDYQQRYECELDESDYPWHSKVFDPETFSAVETIYPRIANTMLGGPEVFGVKPTEQSDIVKARVTKQVLDYQADRLGVFEKLTDVIKDGLIYGTGICKIRWRREMESRWEPMDVLDELGLPTGQKEKRKVFIQVHNQPEINSVDIRDFYVDPDATSIEDARFVIHETKRTRDYLKKKQAEGTFFNVDLIPENDSSVDGSDSFKGNTLTLKTHDKNMDLVKIHEYWGLCDIDEDGYLEEVVITVANGSTLIGIMDNPFVGGLKPFIRYTPIPRQRSFYGISVYQPIRGITDALNDRTNQIADNIGLLLNGMYKVNRHADVDPDQLVSTPGGFIEVNMSTDVEPLVHQDIVPSVFSEVGRLEQKIQKALGVYDYAAGGAPQRQEAATTVISLQQVAEIRFKTMTIMFERQIIRPLGNKLIKFMRKYMDPVTQMRIVGRESQMPYDQSQIMTIGPDDLVEDADIYAVGAGADPSISKQAQLEGIMNFMALVGSNPNLSMNPMFGIDWSAIVEELPYLLSLKLKRPLIIPINPQLAYQEKREDEQMGAQVMMGQFGAMQGAMMGGGPGGEEQELPSRTKGELAKRKKEE